MSLPHSSAITVPDAKNGPNGIGLLREVRFSTIADLLTITPIMGALSIVRSAVYCMFIDRLQMDEKIIEPPTLTSSMNGQFELTQCDASTIIWVNVGKSDPKLLNIFSKEGITDSGSTMITTIAIDSTTVGYINADLTLLFIASIFSWYVAIRSSIVSSLPDSLPAATNAHQLSIPQHLANRSLRLLVSEIVELGWGSAWSGL